MIPNSDTYENTRPIKIQILYDITIYPKYKQNQNTENSKTNILYNSQSNRNIDIIIKQNTHEKRYIIKTKPATTTRTYHPRLSPPECTKIQVHYLHNLLTWKPVQNKNILNTEKKTHKNNMLSVKNVPIDGTVYKTKPHRYADTHLHRKTCKITWDSHFIWFKIDHINAPKLAVTPGVK